MPISPLQTERERRNLSRARLAIMTGIPEAVIESFEYGDRKIGENDAQRIAAALTKYDNIDPNLALQKLANAAMLYCAFADWFESRPQTIHNEKHLSQWMDVFNELEATLRSVGSVAMRLNKGRSHYLAKAKGETK